MDVLLTVDNLVKYFPIRSGLFSKVVGYVRAVDGVSFEVKEGNVMALVGESGSGKTTVLRCILRLYEPTSGKILFMGKDVTKLSGRELKWYRRSVQAVFQNPYLSLNPRMKVKDIIAEPLKVHEDLSNSEIESRVLELIEAVGLPKHVLNQHPPALSGGQAQRVAIARALSVRPKLLLLDEPTSALDVSIQAQILDLLMDLKKEYNLTYILVTHDLAVVRQMSDYVTVMYLGKIVEMGLADEIFEGALHPYTQALLSSVPEIDKDLEKFRKRVVKLHGEPGSPTNIPPGCRLSPRCPYATPKCFTEEPPLVNVGNKHHVRCWLVQ